MKKEMQETNDHQIPRQTVLLIEDETELAEEIKTELERSGYYAQIASVAEAADAARAGNAAVIVMDRLVYGEDSLTMLETLRAEGVKVPVLVISALSSVDARIRGLKAGGDDYLTKPFAMAELTARVEALLRRLDDVRATTLRVYDLEMDLIEHRVRRGGKLIDLLPREFKLLEYFLRRPDQVVTRAMLLEDVWQFQLSLETNVVDVHIGNLRRKINARGAPSIIVSLRGTGFTLKTDA